MLTVLASRSPGVAAVRADAEHLPLAARTIDAVLVASAWHWMDTGRTVSEMGRVLRPGGVLGVLWSGPDRSVEWVGQLLGHRDPWPTGPVTSQDGHRVELPPGSPFGHLETRLIRWTSVITQEALVGLAGTYSSVITLPPDRQADEIERIRGWLAVSPELRGRTDIEMPMGCRCWRAVRL